MRVSLRWVIASVLVAGSTIAQAKPGDLMFEFQMPNHRVGSLFGQYMATVGDKVLISSICDDTSGPSAGSVFMYDGSGRLLQTFSNPTPYSGPAGHEYFGGALSSIGNSILIGDKWDSSVVGNGGAVYLFDPNMPSFKRPSSTPRGLARRGLTLKGSPSSVVPSHRWEAIASWSAPGQPTPAAMTATPMARPT